MKILVQIQTMPLCDLLGKDLNLVKESIDELISLSKREKYDSCHLDIEYTYHDDEILVLMGEREETEEEKEKRIAEVRAAFIGEG